MLSIVLGATMAYLLGSIPSGLWIGRKFFQIDIRQHGSGNLGATNSFRILLYRTNFHRFFIKGW